MTIRQAKRIDAAGSKEPLTYDEACWRYTEWCERESLKEGLIPLGVPTPNCGLSHVIGSTWHLMNVNGPLANVGWNGRVWRARREED